MKKITTLFVFAIAVFTINTAIAQTTTTSAKKEFAKTNGNKPVNKGMYKADKKTVDQKAAEASDSLKVKLNLTDVQYAKVKAINSEFFKNRQSLKSSNKLDSTAKKTLIEDSKALKENRNKQIKAVLTTEQVAKWEAIRKENHHQKSANGQGKFQGYQKGEKSLEGNKDKVKKDWNKETK